MSGLAGMQLACVRDDRDSVWAQFTILVDRRESVQAALQAHGIPTAIHYPTPLHRQPAYADLSRGGTLMNSERSAERVLSLPMSADLSYLHQDDVVAALRGALG